VSELPLFARARRVDPASSHAAAEDLEESGRAARQAALVLDLVRRWPGSTSKELAQRGGVDRYLVARRLPELAAAGEVERVGGATKRELRWWPR